MAGDDLRKPRSDRQMHVCPEHDETLRLLRTIHQLLAGAPEMGHPGFVQEVQRDISMLKRRVSGLRGWMLAIGGGSVVVAFFIPYVAARVLGL